MTAAETKRLLLADNSPDYLHSLVGFLEVEGYEVVQAATPQDAITKLEQVRIDLALVDMRLTDNSDDADISGFKVCRRAAELQIPCIVLTAYSSDKAARQALRGIDSAPLARDIIPKSDGAHAVLDAISRVLGRPASGPENGPQRGLYVDLEKGLVTIDGVAVAVSDVQYKVLACLYPRNGGLGSMDELIKAVYYADGSVAVDIERDDVHGVRSIIDRLNEKLKGTYVVNEHGRGFRLDRKPK